MPNENESVADILIERLDEIINTPRKNITGAKLDFIRTLAIETHGVIESLLTRLAFAERDERETWRTVKLLQEAGLLDEDQYRAANSLVTDARNSGNTFTDLDTIRKGMQRYAVRPISEENK